MRGGCWRLASTDGWDVGTWPLKAPGRVKGTSAFGCDVGTLPDPLSEGFEVRDGTGLTLRLAWTVSGRRCQNSSSSRASMAALAAASSPGVSLRLGMGALSV